MGTLQHKALVVVADDLKGQQLWTHALLFNERLVRQGEQPVPLSQCQPVSNGTYTFIVLPTGSKVGWPRHKAAEELMADLEALAKTGRGQGQWASTARVEWGELDTAVFVDGSRSWGA